MARLSLLAVVLAACFCLTLASFNDSIQAESNLMVGYWGQCSAGNEGSLASYCSGSTYDIIVIGFMPQFGSGGDISINFAGHCWQTFPGTNLLHCSDIGRDIQTCQSQGKRVFLSLGGGEGNYGLSSDDQGNQLAQTVWDMFLGGWTNNRPFDSAKLDGIDLDIEKGDPSHYGAFVNTLSNLFNKDTSKRYYISAAPQCPFPDAFDGPYSWGSALDQGKVDYIWVQFYNNLPTCGLPNPFNYHTWSNWAQNHSPKTRVVVGVLGANSGGAGFIDANGLQRALGGVRWDGQFGGVMVWDVSLAAQNNFGQQISQYLKN